MKKDVRLFVCLRPDAGAVKAWEQFRQKAPAWPLRWVPSESLHITLKFLGETTTDLQPRIVTALEAVPRVPLMLGLKDGGIFSAKGLPSIFWIGMDGDIAKLTQLVAAVEQACVSLGFKPEPRAFQPHLTVARLRSDYDATKKKQWLTHAYEEWIPKFQSMPFVINDMYLMKSVVSPAGAQYQTVATIGF